MEFTEYHTRLAAYALIVDDFFTARGRSFDGWLRSQRFVFDATITGGDLGTTEVAGSTDRAEWVPLADLEGQARASIVDVALAAREARA